MGRVWVYFWRLSLAKEVDELSPIHRRRCDHSNYWCRGGWGPRGGSTHSQPRTEGWTMAEFILRFAGTSC